MKNDDWLTDLLLICWLWLWLSICSWDSTPRFRRADEHGYPCDEHENRRSPSEKSHNRQHGRRCPSRQRSQSHWTSRPTYERAVWNSSSNEPTRDRARAATPTSPEDDGTASNDSESSTQNKLNQNTQPYTVMSIVNMFASLWSLSNLCCVCVCWRRTCEPCWSNRPW